MDFNNRKPRALGIFWGIVHGLVALGFYFTPWMYVLLGMASVSTAIALLDILKEEFAWYFALLGALLVVETILIYLRQKGVKKLTLAEINPYRAFIGTIVGVFALTYFALFLAAAFIIGR